MLEHVGVARKMYGGFAAVVALGEARELPVSLVERHPELRGPSGELLVKAAQLERLCVALGAEVIEYSHLNEDATVGAP